MSSTKLTRSCTKDKNKKTTGIEETLQQVFPLKIVKNDVTLDQDPENDVRGLNSREITFVGEYRNVEVSCVCVIVYGDSKYHLKQYHHGFTMSQELMACRNMANYFGMFKEQVAFLVEYINDPPSEPALFILKPYFPNGTVAHYMKTLRKTDKYLAPLHLLQMAIGLFSILSDAHTQEVGLVDITVHSLYVSLDRGIYFDGFQSCIRLNNKSTHHPRSWMVLKSLKCPESQSLTYDRYTKSTDVFLAASVLLELVRKYDCKCKRLYERDRSTKTIRVITKYVDERHKGLIPMIEKCLSVQPQDRPKAEEVLYWLESLRYLALKNA